MWAIILNVLVLALLALGIFISFRRGLKKSLVHFAVIIGVCIIAILITPPITSALLGINVGIDSAGAPITLEGYLYSSFAEIFATSATLETFMSSIVSAILGPVVFLAVLLLLCVVFESAYLVASKYGFSKMQSMQENKSTRKYGLIVGLVECGFVLILAFMPLTSLTNSVTELSTSAETNCDVCISNILNENLPPVLSDFIIKYNGSPLGIVTNWGNATDVVFDAVSPIYAGETKFSLREDLVPLAKDYDLIIESISDLSNIDYNTLRESANNILNSQAFETIVSGGANDILENKTNFVNSLGLDNTLRGVVLEILNNVEVKMAQADFNIANYISENVNIAIDELESNIDLETVLDFTDAVTVGDKDLALSTSLILGVSNALESAIKLPIVEELFPYILYLFELMPATVTDILDTYYLDTYDSLKTDAPHIINTIRGLATSVDTSTNQNLLQILLSNDTTFMQKFVNSDKAGDVLKSMAESNSLRNLVINAFERMDDELLTSLQAVNENTTINERQIAETISFSNSESEQNTFLDKVSEQSFDIITIARIMLNKEIDLNSGQFLDLLKENVIKYFDFTENTSNSVFNTIFRNIIAYFDGTILDSLENTPAFNKSNEFNALLNNAYNNVPEEQKIYGEYSIYLTVSWSEIFEQLL